MKRRFKIWAKCHIDQLPWFKYHCPGAICYFTQLNWIKYQRIWLIYISLLCAQTFSSDKVSFSRCFLSIKHNPTVWFPHVESSSWSAWIHLSLNDFIGEYYLKMHGILSDITSTHASGSTLELRAGRQHDTGGFCGWIKRFSYRGVSFLSWSLTADGRS